MKQMDDMKTIQIGEKFDGKFDFRETCFGIVLRGDELLLVKKNGQYSLIGGGIENAESKKDCLKREFMEEAGLQILGVKEFVCVDCFWLAAGKYPLESKANVFIVEVDFDTQVAPTDEGHEVEFVALERALDLLPLPYHKAAIKEFLSIR